MKYGYNIFCQEYIYIQYIADFIIYMVVLSRNRDIIKLIVGLLDGEELCP